MTISEQLQFSVLTAPVASLDRRTLSQAWYSALYGGGSAGARTAGKPGAPAAIAPAPRLAHPAPAARVAHTSVAVRHCAGKTANPEGSPLERRAPRSAMARKIERAFLRPRSAARKTSFTLHGNHGRVHVLLQAHGTHLKLVAICPPKARADVAAALAQARYALALRGIDVTTGTRAAAC